jgi:hypothetical protein
MISGPTAGVGLKPQHYQEALAAPAAGLWFEVHAENYMCDGGPRLAWLEAVRAHRPLSLHGVGMSLAGAERPDRRHLAALKRLAGRFEPFVVSEHLAWSTWRGVHHPDLLPFPRSAEALARVSAHVDEVQEALGRRILIENPSLYLALDGHDFSEVEFLEALVRRTGCGLLLDVNNVHVSANNLGFDAAAYIDAAPAEAIGEIHLAGHAHDGALGQALLIDSHDAPVSEPVWALYRRLVARIGPRPTLIERDDNIPAFDELLSERNRAEAVLQAPAASPAREQAHA